MTKIIKIESCDNGCVCWDKGYCCEIKKGVEDGKIHPDCPLEDYKDHRETEKINEIVNNHGHKRTITDLDILEQKVGAAKMALIAGSDLQWGFAKIDNCLHVAKKHYSKEKLEIEWKEAKKEASRIHFENCEIPAGNCDKCGEHVKRLRREV